MRGVCAALVAVLATCTPLPTAASPSAATSPPPPTVASPPGSIATRPTAKAAPPWTPSTARPLVWFAPLDPYPRPLANGVTLVGSPDFLDLFSPTAPWPDAAGHVNIFKLYPQFIDTASDADLVRVVTELNRRGIAIALEEGPLPPSATCGGEGFGGSGVSLYAVHRITSAGGTVRYIALDEPYFFGSLSTGPNACQRPADQVAREVSSYIQAVQSSLPGVVIGDIEPLAGNSSSDTYVAWLDTYRHVTGQSLPFFHLDIDWIRPDWPAAAKSLELAARQRGIEFGIIYFGNPDDSSDAAWIGHAAERMAIYEGRAGGKPDHVIFQSWHDHPDRVVPESDATTFTSLINRYFRTRTALTLSLGAAGGPRTIAGQLTDTAGSALGGATVNVSARQLDGPGRYAERTITGTVPAGATHVVLGVRVNTECGCAAASDLVLYGVRYAQDGEALNRAPNAEFVRGLDTWGTWGTGSARIEPGDRGSGSMLHVSATASQLVGVNSIAFPVTAGAAYSATFATRVTPASAGSGYFAVIFLATTEISRTTLAIDPAALALGTGITDASGNFILAATDIPPDRLLVEATYLGSEHYWPAYAQQTVARAN